jgi:hypothetical protein
MQIQDLQAELGSVPALIPIADMNRTVVVTHLIALTGTRFVNAMSLRDGEASTAAAVSATLQASQQQSLRAAAQNRAGGSDAALQPAAKRARAAGAAAPQDTAAAAAAPDGSAPSAPATPDAGAPAAPDRAALAHVVDIVDGHAPARMSAAEALALVDAAAYCMAAPVLQHLRQYLAPFLSHAPGLEVRISRGLRSLLCEHSDDCSCVTRSLHRLGH